MKKQIFTIVTILAFTLFGSCSQTNNQNSKQENNKSQSENAQTSNYSDDDEPEGMDWGDPDEPQEEESSGLSFYVKYIGNDTDEEADIKKFYMFFTTSDNKAFYEYDDEVNYGEYALRCYMVYKSIFPKRKHTPAEIQQNIRTVSPWLGSILDLPDIGPIPKDMKKYLSKIYYDNKNISVSPIVQKYGVQSYLLGNIDGLEYGCISEKDIIFTRYEKKEGDGFDEIPDESVMIRYAENITFL